MAIEIVRNSQLEISIFFLTGSEFRDEDQVGFDCSSFYIINVLYFYGSIWKTKTKAIKTKGWVII